MDKDTRQVPYYLYQRLLEEVERLQRENVRLQERLIDRLESDLCGGTAVRSKCGTTAGAKIVSMKRYG